MVGLFRERFGRGPTKVRTYVLDGLVVCVLRNVMSPEDRAVARAGRGDLVQEVRAVVRADMQQALVEAVEGHVEGRVSSVLSDMDPGSDVTVLSFLVETGDT